MGWACVAHLSFCFEKTLYKTFHSFGYLVSEEKIFFRNQPTQSKNCQWWPCLLMDRDEMSNIYRGSSIDASYQVSIHLAKPFQRRRFVRNRPIRNKNCLWLPCLLTDRDNDRRRMPSDGKYSLCPWQGELKTNWKTN